MDLDRLTVDTEKHRAVMRKVLQCLVSPSQHQQAAVLFLIGHFWESLRVLEAPAPDAIVNTVSPTVSFTNHLNHIISYSWNDQTLRCYCYFVYGTAHYIPTPCYITNMPSRSTRSRLLFQKKGIRDEYHVDLLGMLLCHLDPEAIRTHLLPAAVPAALQQLRGCVRLTPEQRASVRDKVLQLYGYGSGHRLPKAE